MNRPVSVRGSVLNRPRNDNQAHKGSSAPSGVGPQARQRRRGRRAFAIGVVLVLGAAAVLGMSTRYESYTSLFDAEYVGAAACADCHPVIYGQWKDSPHALMVRKAAADSVVGNFDDGTYAIPAAQRSASGDEQPAARMYHEGDMHYMALRDPGSGKFVPFAIERVVGYQYRQTYLTREPGGVLRRLPLQWSTYRQEFFPYWNLQEGSRPSVEDLWAQMRSMNSAWNLYCARCHTTNLDIEEKDAAHTMARTSWTNDGIACEACHGPGSHHAAYFESNRVNRLVAFVNSKLRGQPVAYVANAPKMTKGQDLSVCARCHGPDIAMPTTEVYREYEPGYSREGRINDLSPFFKEFPLQPGRKAPTVECWDDGRPKGIAMLFRSFIESSCYDHAEVRCYDCHQVHANKLPARADILVPSKVSDGYCLECHGELRGRLSEHTHHKAGGAGSHCYDCHMPRSIYSIVGGYEKYVRTHTMSHVPRPDLTARHGSAGSPNACNDCHDDKDAAWAVSWMVQWWPGMKERMASAGGA
jgi:hypothetical protein